jgi:hypothetical protein
LLGINDCFSFKADDPAETDRRISDVFASADRLLAAFREALPAASLAICTVPPPNARDAAFVANYKGKYDRWNCVRPAGSWCRFGR